MPGNGCKPIAEANGENGIYMPISMIAAVITIKGSANSKGSASIVFEAATKQMTPLTHSQAVGIPAAPEK